MCVIRPTNVYFLYTIGMLLAWFHSIFNFHAYHRLALLSAGKTALFGVWITLVSILCFYFYASWQISVQLPTFLNNFPPLSFEQGELKSPAKRTLLAIPQTPYGIVFDAQTRQAPAPTYFLENQVLALVGQKEIFIPSVGGVQSQPIPSQWDSDITPQTLLKEQANIAAALRTIFLFGGAMLLIMFFFGSFCMATAVLFFWKGITRQNVSLAHIFRWAVFLQGPAFALWLVNLFIGVPLFLFAVFILFMMYCQQIFNTLPERKQR